MARGDNQARTLIRYLMLSLAGRYGSNVSSREAANLISEAYGSGRAASRALGVAESTLRGWRHGTPPRLERAAQLALWVRQFAATLPAVQAFRNGETELAIEGAIAVSKDVRDRVIHPGRVIPNTIIRRALAAWTRGEDLTAGRTLLRAIDRYYTPVDFRSIRRVFAE